RRWPLQRRNDTEFEAVARKQAPGAVARLEIEIMDGARIRGRADQLDRRRLGADGNMARLVRKPPGELAAFWRLLGAREPDGDLDALADADRLPRRSRNDQPRPLQVGEPVGESARTVRDVHEPIRFPLHVIELSDHVAGYRPLPAQRLDLIFERPILKLLRRVHEPVDVAEDRREPRVPEPRFEPMRIGASVVPIVAALEPPGLASVLLQNIAGMRQSPHAEFRTNQRLAATSLGVAVRRPGPRGAGRECA